MINNEDFGMLLYLLDQYSVKGVVAALSVAALIKADQLSDLGLKERALELANGSDHLHGMLDNL